MLVTLPTATAAHIGDLVAVAWDLDSLEEALQTLPQAGEYINGVSSFDLTKLGQCVTFIVASEGQWWIAAEYMPDDPV